MTTEAIIGLGANLGNATATLQHALSDMHGTPGIAVTRVSSLYCSAPVDAGGPDYTNAVALIQTRLAPLALLRALQTIENLHGRTRRYHHAPRTLDLDILLYGDETIDTPELTVPHPRMHQRAFVLDPLCELSPERIIAGQTARQWRQQCREQPIKRLTDQQLQTP